MPSETLIFTTSLLMEGDVSLAAVVHDIEGDWQFFDKHGAADPTETRAVCLGCFVEQHPEVVQFADLERGEVALLDLDGAWKRHDMGANLYVKVESAPPDDANSYRVVALDREKLFEERIELQDVERPGYKSSFAALRERVLNNGGDMIVPPMRPDPLVALLATDGQLHGNQVQLKAGRASDCHANVARLWKKGKLSAIGTGYALTAKDGLWREHSWGIDKAGSIVETTVVRDMYFGVLFQAERAERFAEWIDPTSDRSEG